MPNRGKGIKSGHFGHISPQNCGKQAKHRLRIAPGYFFTCSSVRDFEERNFEILNFSVLPLHFFRLMAEGARPPLVAGDDDSKIKVGTFTGRLSSIQTPRKRDNGIRINEDTNAGFSKISKFMLNLNSSDFSCLSKSKEKLTSCHDSEFGWKKSMTFIKDSEASSSKSVQFDESSSTMNNSDTANLTLHQDRQSKSIIESNSPKAEGNVSFADFKFNDVNEINDVIVVNQISEDFLNDLHNKSGKQDTDDVQGKFNSPFQSNSNHQNAWKIPDHILLDFQ